MIGPYDSCAEQISPNLVESQQHISIFHISFIQDFIFVMLMTVMIKWCTHWHTFIIIVFSIHLWSSLLMATHTHTRTCPSAQKTLSGSVVLQLTLIHLSSYPIETEWELLKQTFSCNILHIFTLQLKINSSHATSKCLEELTGSRTGAQWLNLS